MPEAGMSRNAFTGPGPHLVVRGVLGEALAGSLLVHVLEREEAFAAGHAVPDEARPDPSVRKSKLLRDAMALKGEVSARFRMQLEPALEALRMSTFTLKGLEMEFSAFGDGGFFLRHVDTAPTGNARWRTLTGVYYFHGKPKGYQGGALRLFGLVPAERGGLSVDIAPEHDSLVLFPSWMPHEVLPVSCPSGRFADSRFAVNVWYHRRDPTAAG